MNTSEPNKQIKGRHIKGQGLSSKMGWATINLTNDSNYQPGFYKVYDKYHKAGYAFVFEATAEVHFREPVIESEYGKEFSLDVVYDMFKQYSSPVLEILQLGFNKKYSK